MYSPSLLYDDISICNVIGVYKSGNNTGSNSELFQNEKSFLSNLLPKTELVQQNGEKFVLYPNPANTTITINYELQKDEIGNVIVYDIMGREQMKIELHYRNNRTSINVSSLMTGIYTYKYMINSIQKVTGKLIIE